MRSGSCKLQRPCKKHKKHKRHKRRLRRQRLRWKGSGHARGPAQQPDRPHQHEEDPGRAEEDVRGAAREGLFVEVPIAPALMRAKSDSPAAAAMRSGPMPASASVVSG
jgi:hypothetical protein